MRRSRSYMPPGRAFLLVLLSLCAALCPAQEAPPAPSALDVAREGLTSQIAILEENIQQAEALATEERAAQMGVPLQELQDQSMRLREIQSVVELHLDAMDEYLETEHALETVNEQIASFAGLPDPPPYTPWVVDTYRDAFDARLAQCEIEQVERQQAQRDLDAATADLKAADSALAVINDKLSTASDPSARQSLQWQFDTATVARQHRQAQKARREFALQLSQLRVDLCDRQLEFQERQKKDAESKEQYRPDDLATLRADIAKERDAAAKDRTAAEAQREKDRKRLDQAREDLADPNIEDEKYAVVSVQSELFAVEAEASQDRVAALRDRMDLLYHIEEMWTARYALHTTPKQFSLRQQKNRASDYATSLSAGRDAQERREDIVRAKVRELSQRLAGLQQAVNTLDTTQQQLKIRTAQLDLVAGSLTMIDRANNLATRLLAEIAVVEQRQSLGERLQQIGETAQLIWDRELFNVDGRPLTVRKVGLALIILAVGFAITRGVVRLVRRAFNSRPHIDRNVAASVERLVHYGMVVLVVLVALRTVNIPLTVFAFFGGALAIGVGFGAQNLINNFISGLILMAERPIKIGDVVEVDGQRGYILEIGARCSRVSLFSGVDILVPNSSFLEKNVINWTLLDPNVRFSVRVGVDFTADTRDVVRLLTKAVSEHPDVLKLPAPSVLLSEFHLNGLIYEVQFWLNLRHVVDGSNVASDVRYKIDEYFRDAGIVLSNAPRGLMSKKHEPETTQGTHIEP